MAERQPSVDRRRQIADAALRIIAEQGLGKFTTSTIAREVGLTDGAIFRHFPSKEAIVEAAIDRVEEILFAELPAPADDPLERLGDFIRYRVRVVRDNPGVSRMVFSEQLAQAGGEASAERVAELKRRSLQLIRRCLSEAAERGMLAPGVPVDDLVVVVQGTILALVFAADTTRRAERVWQSLAKLIRR